MTGMNNSGDDALEMSPFVAYLFQEERKHGRKGRELFRLEDLVDSLRKNSSTTMALKGTDSMGREVVRGKAKVGYEANNTFSIREVNAFNGRFTGNALYTPGEEPEWHWDVFPPDTADEGPSVFLRPLRAAVSTRLYGALTEEDRNEVQAMLGRMMDDFRVLNGKTRELIQEIDKAQALFDQEWVKEQAMYTATLEGGAEQNSPLS